MPTLEQRVWFAESYYVTKTGRPFSLKKRPWVVDEFWRAADGWRLAAVNSEHLCEKCRAKLVRREILDQWDPKLAKRLQRPHAKCSGLEIVPIIVTVLNLPRREGKSTNCAGYNLSTIGLSRNKSVLYLAAAGDQTRRIVRDCYQLPIERNERLAEEFEIVGDRIQSKSTQSEIQVAETSYRSITGGGYTHVVVDEGRDVPPRVLAAAVNSTPDQHGWECPFGCYHCGSDAEDRPESCPTCGTDLHPWFARIIIMSSSGIITGTDADWFNDLVEQLDINVSKYAHLFRLEKSTNPAVSSTIKDALAEVLGTIPALATYMDVELGNRPRRLGDDFLGPVETRRILKPIKSRMGDARPTVGFLDTSWSSDITSLNIFADNTEKSKEPWQFLQHSHLHLWKPKELANHRIDVDAIQDHFDRVMPMFPGIRVVLVDCRGMQWARDFVLFCRKERPGWGKKLEIFDGGRANKTERNTSWQLFEQRGLSQTIEIIDDADIKAELKGIRKVKLADDSIEIRDRSRKKRHADIIEGIAGCCYAAWREALHPSMSLAKADRGGAAGLLARIYKPTTGRMRAEDF